MKSYKLSTFYSVKMLLICLIFLSSYTFALDEIDLFKKKTSAYDLTGFETYKDYENLITQNNIKDKQVINIGKYQFKIINYLSAGNMSRVYRVKILRPSGFPNEYALKLPKIPKHYTISQTVIGHTLLEKYNINVPKLILSSKNYFSVFQLVDDDLYIPHFFHRQETLPEEINSNKVHESMLEFSRSTYLFKEISDFHSKQLSYSIDKDKVILLDWHDQHTLIETFSDTTTIYDGAFERTLSLTGIESEDEKSAHIMLKDHQLNLIQEFKDSIFFARRKRKEALHLILQNIIDHSLNLNRASILKLIKEGYTKLEMAENEREVYFRSKNLWIQLLPAENLSRGQITALFLLHKFNDRKKYDIYDLFNNLFVKNYDIEDIVLSYKDSIGFEDLTNLEKFRVGRKIKKAIKRLRRRTSCKDLLMDIASLIIL